MRFVFNTVDEYISENEQIDETLVVTLYSKNTQESGKHSDLETGNTGIYNCAIFLPKDKNELLKAVESCINILLYEYEFKLKGETQCQFNQI